MQGSDRLAAGADKPRAADDKKQRPSRAKAQEGTPAPAEARAQQPKKTEAAPPPSPAEGKEKAAKPVAKAPADVKGKGKGGKAAPEVVATPPPPPRLRDSYRQAVVPAMVKEFGYKNAMEVPRLDKIVLHIGMGEALTNPKAMESATRDITTIVGQRPVTTLAKKSVANFKVRKGQAIGLMATIRGNRMYDFLDRLVNIALPRIRDFRGVPRDAFDGRGNYSLGLREQVMFPEIDYNTIDRVRGMQVNVCTTAKTDNEGRRLLELMGMPFVKPGEARGDRDGKQPAKRAPVPTAPPAEAGEGKGASQAPLPEDGKVRADGKTVQSS